MNTFSILLLSSFFAFAAVSQEEIDWNKYDKEVLVEVAKAQALKIKNLESEIEQLKAKLTRASGRQDQGEAQVNNPDENRDVNTQTLATIFSKFPERLTPEEGGSWSLNPHKKGVEEWIAKNAVGKRVNYSMEVYASGFILRSALINNGVLQGQPIIRDNQGESYTVIRPNANVSEELRQQAGRNLIPSLAIDIAGRRVFIPSIDVTFETGSKVHIDLDRAKRLGKPFSFTGTITECKVWTPDRSHWLDISIKIDSVDVLDNAEAEVLDSYSIQMP